MWVCIFFNDYLYNFFLNYVTFCKHFKRNSYLVFIYVPLLSPSSLITIMEQYKSGYEKSVTQTILVRYMMPLWSTKWKRMIFSICWEITFTYLPTLPSNKRMQPRLSTWQRRKLLSWTWEMGFTVQICSFHICGTAINRIIILKITPELLLQLSCV